MAFPQPIAVPNLSGLREEMTRLLDEGEKDALLSLVLGLLEKMATANTQLALRLQAVLRQVYRKKSEKLSPQQLALFLSLLPEEALTAAQAAEAEDSSAQAVPPGVPAKRPQKRPFPEGLRREVRRVPVPEGQRHCAACGEEKAPMGYEGREVWEFKPAEFYIIEERLEKRACKTCQEGVVTAEAITPKPIEAARPGPGLLAQIVTSKLRDACPLYRQSQIYKRSGIHLSPSTLGEWFAATADMLLPLWQVAKTQTLAKRLLSLDDTGMPVLDKEAASGIKRGHIWTYLGNVEEAGFCEYTPTWEAKGPLGVLEGFTGEYVQGDGYAGINAYFETPNAPTRVGCMDHCRRKFVAALEAGHVRAAVVLQHLQGVYAVERKAREEGLLPDALLACRQQYSLPLMEKVKALVADMHLAALPKSALGKATTYAIRQWPTLTVFLEDGSVPLSNIHVEQQQRRTALGRKNYLFAGSDEGARRLAILQTFVVLCEVASLDVFEYLRDVLGKLNSWPMRHLAQLLPAAWLLEKKRQQPDAEAAPRALLPLNTS